MVARRGTAFEASSNASNTKLKKLMNLTVSRVNLSIYKHAKYSFSLIFMYCKL
jgi:hypothetical protein